MDWSIRRRDALNAFLEVYERHIDELEAATMRIAESHAEFGPIVKATPPDQLAARNIRSRQLVHDAIVGESWVAYDEDLRTQGDTYAKMGISFAGWYDIVALVNRAMVPILVRELIADPARLSNAIMGMQWLMDHAMVIVGQQYLEAKQAEVRASQAASMRAEEATRAKSDFLAMMSHELRTPLNSIIGFSEVLDEEEIGPLNPRQKRYVRNVADSGRHLLHLINELLDLSKIEAGRLEVAMEPCSVLPLLEQVVAALRPIGDRRQVTLHLDATGVTAAIEADPIRLKQVFYNLVSNAIKFSHPGGRVEIHARSADATLTVAVRDHGIGISPDDQRRLFSAFTQLAGAQGAENSGTGLGLLVSKQLVELMGGQITVDSEIGQGATFTVTLRSAQRDAVGVPAAREQRNGRTALVIDDDPQARELIDLVLQEEGFRTVHAASGEEALQLAPRQRFDLVTVDVLLPGLDGWGVLRLLRQEPTTTDATFIIISVSSDRHAALSLGAVEHLVKPVARDALVATLRRHGLSGGASNTTILAIDDDPNHLELVTTLLQPLGYRVLTADRGRAGLQLAQRHAIDLVLLDLVMPDISGIEVARALRADPRSRDVPILLVTSQQLSEAERLQLNSEVESILAKGDLSIDSLRDQIHRAIASRQ